MTRQHAGFAGVVPVPHGDAWPRPRGCASPARLDAGVETLAGRRADAREAAARARDRLRRRPAAPPPAAVRARRGRGRDLAALGRRRGGDRRRRPGRAHAAARRRPPLDRDRAWCGTTPARSARRGSTSRGCSRSSPRARPVRLRGKLGRYGFDVKSYDLGDERATADFAPVYPASEAVPSTRLRELVRAALADASERAPRDAAGRARAAAPPRRARRRPLPRQRGAGRAGAQAAGARRAGRAAARRRPLAPRRRGRRAARRRRAS